MHTDRDMAVYEQTEIWLCANRQRHGCVRTDINVYVVYLLPITDKIPGKRNGGQVADSRLFRAGVLNDLSTQVAALDGAQVLLVGLSVAAVLVQHVWVASLNLHLP